MREIEFTQAIAEAIAEEMERDRTTFMIGTNVGRLGGAMGQLKKIYEMYGPERVRMTPISEDTIVGSSIGAAATGLRPIAEVSFSDFLTVCWDELANQVSKWRWSLGDKFKMPVTITSLTGGGIYTAYQHSQCLEGMLIGIPGLTVVLPSTPYDCKGLLKAAIRDDNPVLFLEHKYFMISRPKSMIPEEDYTIPLGKADIKREGNDVTVVATGLMVHRALAAADRLLGKGITLEVVDPRTLVPLDKQVIFTSVKKTGRLIIVTEECKTGSWAGEVAALVAEEAFDYLDAPIKRVNAPDAPVPYGPAEDLYMPSEEDLIRAVADLTN